MDLRDQRQQHLVADLQLQRRRPGHRSDGRAWRLSGRRGRRRRRLRRQHRRPAAAAVRARRPGGMAARLRASWPAPACWSSPGCAARTPRTGWLIAVGGAFAASAVVFSYASGIFHPYYVSLPRPVDGDARRRGRRPGAVGRPARAVVGAVAIAAGAITELVVLGKLERLAVVGQAAGHRRGPWWASSRWRSSSPRGSAGPALAVTLAALLAAPATWAAETIGHATSSTFPSGGPASASMAGRRTRRPAAASAAPAAGGRSAPGRDRRSGRPRRRRLQSLFQGGLQRPAGPRRAAAPPAARRLRRRRLRAAAGCSAATAPR